MYVPALWPTTAAMLAELERGVTDIAGELLGVDLFGVDFEPSGRSWPPTVTTRAASRRTSTTVRHTWGIADHFWFVRGYIATRFGYWPVEGRGAFRGPVRAHGTTVPPLIFALRHDPATPYRWGQRMARDLGARLLTVHGEGHGAIPNPCVMELAKRYLEDLEVPAPGVTCREPKPFGAPAAARAAAQPAGADLRRMIRRERPPRRAGACRLPALVRPLTPGGLARRVWRRAAPGRRRPWRTGSSGSRARRSASTALRPGQREAIEAALAGRDVLVVMSTGAGKSAIYQIAGLLTPGATRRRLAADRAAARPGRRSCASARRAARRSSTRACPRPSASAALAELAEDALEFLFLAPEQLANAGGAGRARGRASRRCSWSTRRTASPSGATTSGPSTCGSARRSRRSGARRCSP